MTDARDYSDFLNKTLGWPVDLVLGSQRDSWHSDRSNSDLCRTFSGSGGSGGQFAANQRHHTRCPIRRVVVKRMPSGDRQRA